ncbi:MAG: sulfotransferase [Roseovarius sp.]
MTIPHLLLCVGAQKSGTTWLYNRLASHAETRRGILKELHYFNAIYNDGMLGPQAKANQMRRMIEKQPEQVIKYFQAQANGKRPPQDVHRIFRPMNDKWYIGNFRGKGRYALDFTPEYCRLPDEGHDHIKRLSDHQKVIYLMREPLDRSLSAVRYVFKQRKKNIADTPENEIMEVARKPVITHFSDYMTTVETLERNYAPENLRFFIYETMMNDKTATLDTICDWLEIPRLDLPADTLESRDNSTEAADLPATVVDFLRERTAPFREAVEARLPEARTAWAGIARG